MLGIIIKLAKLLIAACVGHRAHDQGPRSGFGQANLLDKIRQQSPHLSSTSGALILHTLHIWGSEWGQRRVSHTGDLKAARKR